jgi:mono/diheme cytochrome c family protein
MSSLRYSTAGARLRLSLAARALLALALLWLALPPSGSAQDSTPPPDQLDGEAGLTLFGERCANCHGPLGAGDGEMTGQLPVQPAALNDAAFARRQVPSAVFETITNGIAASGMPPFGPENSDPISEEDRWHLVAAVLSLGVPSGALGEGETAYAASCAECHGDGGSAAFDMTSQEYWIDRSDEDVFAALRDTEAVPEHEAYTLEDGELLAVVAYARTFSYDYANPLAAFEPIETINVTGIVRNETTGEFLAEGTPVVLNTFTADFAPSDTMTGTLDATGQYGFNLTMVPPDL